MIRALIVDDEIITRKGLKSHVNWEKLGITEIYDTGNAKDAFQLMQEVKPDVILSDICMPGINGIEMCKKLKEIDSECQIVFLSGYSDKEYLMGAIEVEAVNYVEKPICIEEVEAALAKAVEKRMAGRIKKEKMRRLLTENYTLIQKRLVEQLIMPHAKIKLIEQDLKRLHMDWSEKERFVVCLFHMRGTNQGEGERNIKEIRRELAGISFAGCVKEYSSYVLICAFAGEWELEVARRLVHTLQEKLIKKPQNSLYCVIGNYVSEMEQIYISYQAAVVEMQQLRFWNQTKISWANKEEERVLVFDEKILEEYVLSLKRFDEKRAFECIETLYQEMKKQHGVMVEKIKGIYFRFLDELLQRVRNRSGNQELSESMMASVVWEKLRQAETLEVCQDYVRSETQEYFKSVDSMAENNQTIIMIVSYIQKNYNNPGLCLEEIAERVYLSPNYLSSLFKKKVGKTVSQYMTDVRVEQAQKMLRDRKLKLYDVAVRCGYKDANYFTKIFKKSVGITPSEYREKYNI